MPTSSVPVSALSTASSTTVMLLPIDVDGSAGTFVTGVSDRASAPVKSPVALRRQAVRLAP